MCAKARKGDLLALACSLLTCDVHMAFMCFIRLALDTPFHAETNFSASRKLTEKISEHLLQYLQLHRSLLQVLKSHFTHLETTFILIFYSYLLHPRLHIYTARWRLKDYAKRLSTLPLDQHSSPMRYSHCYR